VVTVKYEPANSLAVFRHALMQLPQFVHKVRSVEAYGVEEVEALIAWLGHTSTQALQPTHLPE
jgi:hypothetical protein